MARQITANEAAAIADLLESHVQPGGNSVVGMINRFLLEDPPQLDEVVAHVEEWVSSFWTTEEELVDANELQEASDAFDAVLGRPPRGPDDPPAHFRDSPTSIGDVLDD